jgi:hypothetical protein
MDVPARFSHRNLKDRQRAIRDGFSESLSLRVHRALSWLKRAEREREDGDARFIFLWIAFNSAYANDFHDRQAFPERKVFLNFLERLIGCDDECLLEEMVWDEFPNAIRLLIDNRYVFQAFWDYHNKLVTEEQWRKQFDQSKRKAHRALGRRDTLRVLDVMFDRLYVLRNQLIHGGATWNSGVNRSKIAQGAKIMGMVVPIVIHMMMENADQVWGEPCYPVVD